MRQWLHCWSIPGWHATQRNWTVDLIAFALNVFHTVTGADPVPGCSGSGVGTNVRAVEAGQGAAGCGHIDR